MKTTHEWACKLSDKVRSHRQVKKAEKKNSKANKKTVAAKVAEHSKVYVRAKLAKGAPEARCPPLPPPAHTPHPACVCRLICAPLRSLNAVG